VRRKTFLTALAAFAASALFAWMLTTSGWLLARLQAQKNPSARTPDVLPIPEPPFRGVIGRKASQSKPDFPKEVTAPKGAPNVLLIMTDDTGFGASSTFGGPISTPTFDRIAQRGLRYNNFHTTALCSPTRAALLTGRNHHSVGFGNISEFATGYPGYDSILPKSAGTIANILTTATIRRGSARTT
jgi:arylsulfatase